MTISARTTCFIDTYAQSPLHDVTPLHLDRSSGPKASQTHTPLDLRNNMEPLAPVDRPIANHRLIAKSRSLCGSSCLHQYSIDLLLFRIQQSQRFSPGGRIGVEVWHFRKRSNPRPMTGIVTTIIPRSIVDGDSALVNS